MCKALDGLDAFILECNHDPELLARGPYPVRLQRRVGGRYGHLSNEQAADLLRQIDTARLQHLVAAHLSEKNNRAELACQALSAAVSCLPGDVSVAEQDRGISWRAIAQC